MASAFTAETMREHRARWFAYAGGEKIPRTSDMRGPWGYDVECLCGWKTCTGGAVRRYVEDQLWYHRWDEQCKIGPPDPESASEEHDAAIRSGR